MDVKREMVAEMKERNLGEWCVADDRQHSHYWWIGVQIKLQGVSGGRIWGGVFI